MDEYQNDRDISDSEAESLDRIVIKYMGSYRKTDLKIINVETGMEETAPLTMIDDFGGNAIYGGEISMFGLLWKVYSPPQYYERPIVNKWYYNEKVASILNETLREAVPGKIKNYFDIPPWVFAIKYQNVSRYVPIYDIINDAINHGVIPGWYYLSKAGLNQEFIEAVRNRTFQL